MEPVYAGEVVTGEVMCEREVEIDVPYGQVADKQGKQRDLPTRSLPGDSTRTVDVGAPPARILGFLSRP